MLSVCIPIYNTDVSELVNSLLAQAHGLTAPLEIILIDDRSPLFVSQNSLLKGNTVTYIGLNENIGRARIRNKFFEVAKYEYLIFLDCDSNIRSPRFLQTYLTQAQSEQKVVCGGRVYSVKPPEKTKYLHWKYGTIRESKPAFERANSPHTSFMTNNFMIKKEVMEKVKFDERLSVYGHEDTLFGYELKKHAVPVTHIDNPVVHGELQTNKEFLKKTEEALGNLKKIVGYVTNDKGFINTVTLLRYYDILKASGLLFAVKASFYITKPLLKPLLLKGYAGTSIFNFYKLGYFATLRSALTSAER